MSNINIIQILDNNLFKLISDKYPGLLEQHNGLTYFKNKSISDKPIMRNGSDVFNQKHVVKLRGHDINLILNISEKNGILDLDYDLMLDDKTCVELFNMNIKIIFWEAGSIYEYDSHKINREFIIDSIINS